jgi:hypothetical protein
MTSRMDLAGAAMAALALIISGVTTAHALNICYVNPSRCYYGYDGRYYYSPPGYPRTMMPGGARAVRSPNGAAWGCGATDGKARGRSWNSPNRAAAAHAALAACDRFSPGGKCRIISCSPSVHTIYDAQTIWRPYVYR